MNARFLALTVLTISTPAGTATAVTLHVPGDYSTIQAAVNAAVDGDEVLVAPGTYNEVVSVSNKAIALRSSGGPDVTTIAQSNLFGTVRLLLVESDTIFDGFTVRDGTNVSLGQGMVTANGSPTIMNCIFRNAQSTSGLAKIGPGEIHITNCQFIENSDDIGDGGGLEISNASAVIMGCTFVNNHAANEGGGLSASVPVVVEDCMFTGNTSDTHGGGFASFGGTLTQCQFTDNSAVQMGGGVSSLSGSPTISACTFHSNDASTGAGAHLAGGAIVTGSTFSANESTGDGAALVLDDATAIDCQVFDNLSSGNGGGIVALGTAATVSGCHVTGNSATGTGGGLQVAAGVTVTLTDSFLCANTPDQIGNQGLIDANGVIACNELGPQVGACCLPAGDCIVATEDQCLTAGGTYLGDGLLCDGGSCPEPCPGDTNDDGIVNVIDLLNLLAAWGTCL